MINKAFDTLMDSKDFDAVKMELEVVRRKYFAGLVKDAAKEQLINLDTSGKTEEQLFRPKKAVRNAEGFERVYIDTKGSMKMPEIWGPKDTSIVPFHPHWDVVVVVGGEVPCSVAGELEAVPALHVLAVPIKEAVA